MNIETIEAVARQKISLAAVRPSSNSKDGELFIVEFTSGVAVSVKELERFEHGESDHFHDVNKCQGCKDTFNRGGDVGLARGIKQEIDRRPKIDRSEIVKRLNSRSWTPSKDELADYIVSLLDG